MEGLLMLIKWPLALCFIAGAVTMALVWKTWSKDKDRSVRITALGFSIELGENKE